MTPLLGTTNPSAPVGDKSGGDRRAARSLLSCALWRGMGRLWRGMGGMGRPEPLSAHRPQQQQGLSGFHKTRNTNHGFYASLPTISRYFPAPPPPSADQVSTRRPPFLVSRPDCRAAPPGRCFPARCGAVWGGYGAAWAATVPRTGNTAFPVHQTSDISSGANQSPQPWFSRNTKHETRITAFVAVRFSVGARGVASQETAVRTTAPAGKSLFSCSPLFTIVHHCSPKNIVLRQFPRAARSLLSCALWRGMGRLWRGMGGRRPPHRQHRLSGFHETRDPRPGFFRITAFLHAREFPYNHWRAAGRSSPACPHGSRRWLDTSPHL